MVLVTEWKRFRQPDFAAMKDLMRSPVIFDGRNQYDPEVAAEHGFVYFGIGRGQRKPVAAIDSMATTLVDTKSQGKVEC